MRLSETFGFNASVLAAQQLLIQLNYPNVTSSGVWDNQTGDAMTKFFAARGQPFSKDDMRRLMAGADVQSDVLTALRTAWTNSSAGPPQAATYIKRTITQPEQIKQSADPTYDGNYTPAPQPVASTIPWEPIIAVAGTLGVVGLIWWSSRS